MAVDSLVSGGCIICGSTVRRSLLFSNVRVHSFCTVRGFRDPAQRRHRRHCVVRRAVIDKDCRLPDGITVGVDAEATASAFT